MAPLAETLSWGLLKAEPRPLPRWLEERLAIMTAWGERNLSGARLELFKSFVERERYAGNRGLTLRRLKGTVDPWDPSVADDVAEAVHYYEVPLQSDEEHHWEALCRGMLTDDRLTPELASQLGEKAKALQSATPERLARLREAYRQRFGGAASASDARQRQWASTSQDDFRE